MRERVVATVLSFVFPGLGQIYNRQTIKGLYFGLIQIVGLLITAFTGTSLLIVLLIFGPFAIWAAWDAYVTAARRAFYRAFQ